MFFESNYIVHEHVSFLKLVDKYDIIDPETNTVVAYAKENISGFMKFLRLVVKKSMMNTTVEIKNSATDEIEYVLQKKVAFLRPKVFILDKNARAVIFYKVCTGTGRVETYRRNRGRQYRKRK